jgi:serine/threonine-protein kinase
MWMSRKRARRRRAKRSPKLSAAPERRRYEVLCRLGAGGMAEVFKARARGAAGFQRNVVLKRLHPANRADPEFVSMFADEARLLGTLHHPNVVQALDFYEDGDQHYLVLEYVEGFSLSRVLLGRRAVPPGIVAYVGREVCRALSYVHAIRADDGTPLAVIHRDVTPSNIMITPSGTVKLLDFGVAKFASATHTTGSYSVKGKPSYLAPEQLEAGKTIDGRVDLFALGIVLHELLTGQRLFCGDNDLATLKQILEKKIAPPSSARGDVPRALDRVVMRALERDPARRYSSAALMARDLDEVLVASQLNAEDLATFAYGIGRPPPIPDDAAVVPTRRDLRLPLVMWMNAVPGGRRGVLVAGLTFALGMGTLGFGRTLFTSRAARAAPAPTVHVPTEAPAAAPALWTAR